MAEKHFEILEDTIVKAVPAEFVATLEELTAYYEVKELNEAIAGLKTFIN